MASLTPEQNHAGIRLQEGGHPATPGPACACPDRLQRAPHLTVGGTEGEGQSPAAPQPRPAGNNQTAASATRKDEKAAF